MDCSSVVRRLGPTFIWGMSVDSALACASAFFDLIVCLQLSDLVFDRNHQGKTGVYVKTQAYAFGAPAPTG